MDGLAFAREGYQSDVGRERTGMVRGSILSFALKGALSYELVDESAEQTFAHHAKRWRRDTRHLSSPADRYLHPSYARIIGLGQVAVPLILASMKRDPDDWFYALRAITGANPVTPSMAGNMKKMTEAWTKWGEKNRVT